MESKLKVRFSICLALTVTVISSATGETTDETARATKPLPEAIASFGAVASDGWIYIYSGHIGTAHEHSKDNLSQYFRRRPVEGGKWEELPRVWRCRPR